MSLVTPHASLHCDSTSLLGAVNKDIGVVLAQVITGDANAGITKKFLTDLVERIRDGQRTRAWPEEILSRPFCIILDNDKQHHCHDVKRFMQSVIGQNRDLRKDQHIIFKYLSPYSPFLNPIEGIFSMTRAKFVKESSEKIRHLAAGTASESFKKASARYRSYLHNAAASDKAVGFYRQAEAFVFP